MKSITLIVKKSTLILFLFCSVLSLSARANLTGDEFLLVRSNRYEGSVSLGYSWLISLNLETVHGVRFSGPDIFIGGQAGLSYGLPQGFGSYVNVLPRWFFPYGDKLEGYLSLGVGWYNQAGPYRGSSEAPSPAAGRGNYAGGMDLMPEFGLGFRLRNGDAVDVALRCQIAFGLYDGYKGTRGWLGADYYPALLVGYRF